MTENAIEITNLCKIYDAKGKKKGDKKEALKNVSLTIPKGSFYGLLGPNGAGKSTLINILAGLTNKTSGDVVISGVDQNKDARGSRRKIGVVPQEVVLDPFFTISEMLEFYAGFYGVKKADRRTAELIEALGLSDKADLKPRRLSGGMKRRVLIAKALVHTPPIIVLDEPTAGVDVELRTQLWEYVRELNAKGTTILLTTHYLEEAQELCDHISIINHGQVIANDSKKNMMGMMDSKQLSITTNETMDELPKALEGKGATLVEPNCITFQYKPTETDVNALLGFTKAANLSIKDLTTEQPDLEDVFRHLVKVS